MESDKRMRMRMRMSVGCPDWGDDGWVGLMGDDLVRCGNKMKGGKGMEVVWVEG